MTARYPLLRFIVMQVFMFLALPPEQQQALLARGEQGQEDEE